MVLTQYYLVWDYIAKPDLPSLNDLRHKLGGVNAELNTCNMLDYLSCKIKKIYFYKNKIYFILHVKCYIDKNHTSKVFINDVKKLHIFKQLDKE